MIVKRMNTEFLQKKLKRLGKRILALGLAVSMLMEPSMVSKAAGADTVTKTAATKLSSGSNMTLSSNTYYYVDADTTITGSAGRSALTISGTVYLEIRAGATLTCKGGAASGTTGAGAGIEIPSGSKLYVMGEGSIVAYGGNAAAGGAGSAGQNCWRSDDWHHSGAGGNGGYGGGGAGAGIGTKGANGVGGGAGGAAIEKSWATLDEKYIKGNDGKNGSTGNASAAMGALYLYGSVSITAKGGSGGAAGSAGANATHSETGDYKKAARSTRYNKSYSGSGGSGGGGGFPAPGIGSGGSSGAGGAGGGGGGTGNKCSSHDTAWYIPEGAKSGGAGYNTGRVNYRSRGSRGGYGGYGGGARAAGGGGTVYKTSHNIISSNAVSTSTGYGKACTYSNRELNDLIEASFALEINDYEYLVDGNVKTNFVDNKKYQGTVYYGNTKLSTSTNYNSNNVAATATSPAFSTDESSASKTYKSKYPGYTQDGWFYGLNGTKTPTKIFDNAGVVSNTISNVSKFGTWNTVSYNELYANWIRDTYKLTFYSNGGYLGSRTSMDLNVNTLETIPDSLDNNYIPKRTGYRFLGYNTKKDGSGYWIYGNSQPRKVLNESPKKDEPAPTNYVPRPYEFNTDSKYGPDATTEDKKDTPDLWTVTLTSGPNTGTALDRVYPFDENKELYAQWTTNEYNIRYWSEDEAGDPIFLGQDDNVPYNATILKNITAFGDDVMRNHYEFKGWNMYSNQNWKMYQANKRYSTGLTTYDNQEDGELATVDLYASWDAMDSYDIAFNANGGYGEPVDDMAFEGDNFKLPATEDPIRDYYTFLGWNTTIDGKGNWYASTDKVDVIKDRIKVYTDKDVVVSDQIPVTGPVTFYAIWAKNPSVSYHANGGSFVAPIEKVYPAVGDIVDVYFGSSLPVKEGYTFMGWSPDAEYVEGVSTLYSSAGTTSFSKGDVHDLVLYAVWKLNSYTITDNSNFAGFKTENNITSVAHKGAYTFYVDVPVTMDSEELEVFVNNEEMIPRRITPEYNGTSDIRYEYRVTEVRSNQVIDIVGLKNASYRINYVKNGGEFEGDAVSEYTYGLEDLEGSTTITLPVPVREGYVFEAWYENADFSGSPVTQITDTDFGEKLYYAKWMAKTYTIKLNGNGGNFATEPISTERTLTTTATYDTGVSLAGYPTVSKSGYTLLGWAEDKTVSEPTYINGSNLLNLQTEGDVATLYAVWKKQTVQLTYSANGGKMGGYVPDYYDADVTAPQTYAEDVFDESGLKIHSVGDVVKDELGNDVIDIIHYKGEFKGYVKKTGLSSFAVEAGVSEIVTILTSGMTYDGENPALTLESIAREGYVFDGWNTAPNGSGTDYAAGSSITMSDANVTLYAKWTPVKYNIQYHVNAPTEVPTTGNSVYDGLAELKTSNTIKDLTAAPMESKLGSDGTDTQSDISYDVATDLNSYTVAMNDTDDLYVRYRYTYTINAVYNQETSVVLDGSKSYFEFDGSDYSAYTLPTGIGKMSDPITRDSSNVDIADTYYYEYAGVYKKWVPSYKENPEYDTFTQFYTYTVEPPSNSVELANTSGFVMSGTEADTFVVLDLPAALYTQTSAEQTGQTSAYSYYYFLGWAKASDATVPDYIPGQKVTGLSNTAATVDLYAVWSQVAPTKYYVVYDANSGSFAANEAPVAVDKGSSITVTSTIPTKEGFTFSGWATSQNAATAELAAGASYTPTADTVLYAVWTRATASIEYHKFSDMETSVDPEKNVDVQVTTSDIAVADTATFASCASLNASNGNAFVREGYRFAGWTTGLDAGYGVVYNDAASVYIPSDMAGQTMKLYAVWDEAPTVFLNYDANGGAGGPGLVIVAMQSSTDYASATVDVEFGEIPTADVQDGVVVRPSRPGYSFLGWSNTANPTEADLYYAVNAESTPTITLTAGENKVLYAVWKEIPSYKVVYVDAASNSVKVPRDNGIYYDGDKVSVDFDVIPTRTGYSFIGWKAPDGVEYEYTYDAPAETDPALVSEGEGGAGEGGAGEGDPGVNADANKYAINPENAVNNVLTFTALWEEHTYKLKFSNASNLNDDETVALSASINYSDSFHMPAYGEVTDNIDLTSFTAPFGYQFVGWSTGKGNTDLRDVEFEVAEDKLYKSLTARNAAEIHIYPVFVPVDVTIRLHNQGYGDQFELTNGSMGSVTSLPARKFGSEVPILRSVPKTVGYNFDGYYTYSGEDKDKLYYNNDLISLRDLSEATIEEGQYYLDLYATFKEQRYTIYYNQGATTLFTQEVKYGQTIDMPDRSVLSGLVLDDTQSLAGWIAGAGANENYDWSLGQTGVEIKASTLGGQGGKIYQNGENVIVSALIVTKQNVRVSYDGNGGYGVPSDPNVYKAGESECTLLMDPIPTRRGYSFVGWSTLSTASTPTYDYVDGQTEYDYKYLVAGNTTFYAVWKANDYKLVYHENDDEKVGAENIKKQNVTYGEESNVVFDSGRSFSKLGYTFAGWSAARNGYVNYIPGNKLNVPFATEKDTEIDLYAIWMPLSYTIMYNANVPSGAKVTGTMKNTKATYDEDVTLRPNRFKVDGYEFIGWSLAPNGNLAFDDSDDVCNLGTSEGQIITLYAIWEKDEEDDSNTPGGTTPGKPGDTTPGKPGDTTPSNPGDTTPSNPGDTNPSNPGDENQPSVPGSIGTVSEIKNIIENTNTDVLDLPNAKFNKLRAKATGKSKSVTITWKKVSGSTGYIVYGAIRGKKMKALKTIAASKKATYTQKKLSNKKYYKYIVAAYKTVNGQKYVTSISPTIYASPKGGNVNNISGLKTNKKTYSVKKKKKVTIKVTYKKKNVKKCGSYIRFESSNTKIARVSKKGVVTGVKKGTCYVYVYTQSGAYKKVKINVK